MEIEDLWDHTEGLYESKFRRVKAEGKEFWDLSVSELHTNYGGMGEIDLDRTALERLFQAIEKELYPERFRKRTVQEILETFWETKPTHCPICDGPLKKSRNNRPDSDYCGQLHGKTYAVKIGHKIWYKWYVIEGLR